MKSDNRPDISIKARSELAMTSESLWPSGSTAPPKDRAPGNAMRTCVTQDLCLAGGMLGEESITIHWAPPCQALQENPYNQVPFLPTAQRGQGARLRSHSCSGGSPVLPHTCPAKAAAAQAPAFGKAAEIHLGEGRGRQQATGAGSWAETQSCKGAGAGEVGVWAVGAAQTLQRERRGGEGPHAGHTGRFTPQHPVLLWPSVPTWPWLGHTPARPFCTLGCSAPPIPRLRFLSSASRSSAPQLGPLTLLGLYLGLPASAAPRSAPSGPQRPHFTPAQLEPPPEPHPSAVSTAVPRPGFPLPQVPAGLTCHSAARRSASRSGRPRPLPVPRRRGRRAGAVRPGRARGWGGQASAAPWRPPGS